MTAEHVQDLRSARAALVKARRNWAKALAGPYSRDKSDQAITDIVDVQNAIDAIDRAILDEGKLQSEGK